MFEKRKIGLALGGGGARGFAHLGVLITLEENNIPIHAIAGTSMGAAMGAAKAIGTDLIKLSRLLSSLDLNELLQISDSTRREVQRAIGRSMFEYVRGPTWRNPESRPENLARMYELFSLLTANKSFTDVTVPLAVVAADLETGKRVVLKEGKLYQAVTASAAVPSVFSPAAYRGRYLIDGGVVEKVPVETVIEMGANAVIAVDTGAPLEREVKNSIDVLFQSQRITSQHLTTLQLQRAGARVDGRLLLLQPPVGWITMFAFEHLAKAVEAGREEALAHIDDIRNLCKLSRRRS